MAKIMCFGLNTHKSGASVAALLAYIKGKPTENGKLEWIAFLQEPPIRNQRIVNCGNLQAFFDHSSERPRSAIIASKGLHVFYHPNLSDRDVTAVSVNLRSSTADEDKNDVFCASVYCDITLPAIPSKLGTLNRHCKKEKANLFLSLDTNAHSALWADSENARGERFEDFILENDFQLLNVGKEFTFFRDQSRTTIDIMLHNRGLDGIFHNWRLIRDDFCSDHRLLQVEFNACLPERPKVRIITKANWPSFTEKVERKSENFVFENSWDRNRLEEAATQLVTDIIRALDSSCPWRKASSTVPELKWWDSTLDDLKRKKKRLFSRYRQKRTSTRWQQLSDARREYFQTIKRNKRASYQTYMSDMVDMQQVAKVKSFVHKRTNASLGLLRESDNVDAPFLDPKESLQHLIDTHFTGSIENEPDTDEENDDCCFLSEHSVDFITPQKVGEAIKTFGNFKAAGCDDIKPITLKHLGPKTLARLAQIYKASFLLGYQPFNWREARVIFIPKPGKSDYTQARSFRPITLSSFVGKVFERLLLWWLNDTSLAIRPLSQHQHAFRRKRSTENALSNAVERIEGALAKKQFALGVFLDIQGAFDNVSIDAILRGLKKKRVDETFLKWYDFYLKHRKINLEHKGTSVARWLTRGTPQGGVLSPVMWNVVFDEFLDLFNQGFISVTGFADDAHSLAVGPDLDVLKMFMQSAIDQAVNWGNSVGLEFSASKTAVIIFTRRRKYTEPPMLTMNGHDLPYVKTVKYLGVILDSKLSWQPHFDTKLKAAKGHLLQIRSAMGKLWGTRPYLYRWYFTGIILPALLYGAIVWAKICQRKGNQIKLERLNRMAMMGLGHFRKGTPTKGLELITFMPPLPLVVKKEATLAVLRTQNTVLTQPQDINENTPFWRIGHRAYVQSDLEVAGLLNNYFDPIEIHWVWEKSYEVDLDSFDTGTPPGVDNMTDIYTDGSLIKGVAGSGFVTQGLAADHSESHHLGRNCSVFQAEIYAIYKAALWLNEASLQNKNFRFFADNQAAILALHSPHTESQLVLDTMIALNELGHDNHITISWVKAHVGHKGNEEADRLAKLGATSPALQVPNVGISPKTSRSLITDQMIEKWNQAWHAYPKARQTKQWFPDVNRLKAMQLLKAADRPLLSGLVQLFSGHNFLKRHENVIDNTKIKTCRFCEIGDESTEHLIGDCSTFDLKRLTIFGRLRMEPPFEWKLSQVLEYLFETKLNRLLIPTFPDEEDDDNS